MKYHSHSVKGQGRGKLLGFPTINLDIPESFDMKDGIYAVWVTVAGRRFPGALHYGPVPTFGLAKKSLEIFLLDTQEADIPNLTQHSVSFEPVEWLREVIDFNSQDSLIKQIEADVARTRHILQI